jgi:hypothetical protein
MNFKPQQPIELDPPQAPLRGDLILTGGQERALVQHFIERLRAAKASYGRDGWKEKREKAMQHYGSNVNDRAEAGTIFEKSNMTLNLPKRYVRITSARVYDELLTSSPMLRVTVEGKDDDWEDARVMERFAAYKLEEAKIRSVLRQSETLAAIRGECVVKTTWKRSVQRYWRTTEVLIAPNGRPVVAKDGNPVTKRDAFERREDGSFFLARDPSVKIPEKPVWQTMRVPMQRVLFSGLEACPISHHDFYCATTEPCIHLSDFCGLRVDLEIDEVEAMLAGIETPEADLFLSKLRNRPDSGNARDGAEKEKPDEWRGETPRHLDALPKFAFAEVYARVVVDKDGRADEIAALVDLENEQLLTYDYLDNISPTGRRPLRVVRMEPVPHRWYGTGFYELFADRHKFCDLFLNRVNLAASLSGNIKIENPNATEEGLAGEPIEFGTPKTYRLRDGYTPDDVLKVIPIPNDAGPSENLLNMLMQVTQLEAGVVSAGDHGMAGLPAAGLATGIKSLDRVANVLLKNILFDFVTGFEEVLHDAVALILTNYEEDEAARLMGAEKATLLAKYRDITQLPYRCKLQLSASKDADVIENHQQAFKILAEYLTFPPDIRQRLLPVVTKILTVMGIEDVDKALQEVAQAPLALPPGDGYQPGAQEQTPDTRLSQGASQALAQAGKPPVIAEAQQVGDRDTLPADAVIQ